MTTEKGPSPQAPTAPGSFSWEAGFLSASPRQVAAAAQKVDDAEAGIVVLFEERVHTFEADGKSRVRYRRVYKVLSQAAVERSAFATRWAPWHQDRPTVRVRVVTKEGKAFLLDPKTIEVSGGEGGDPDLYTDRRLMRAPLPGLARGAVVEEEVIEDTRPIADGVGSSDSFLVGELVPVQRTRLVLDAPRALPLAIVEPPAGVVRTTRTEADGRVHVEMEAGPLAARPPPADGWPHDVPVAPLVGYTTGSSWRTMAARYSEIVERQIAGAGAELAGWIKDASLAGPARPSRREVAARLLAHLHREIRYTGVEFEDASVIPRRPAEVLARGYGDCKDQAALLVALLRAAGMGAHVALLRVGGLDVDPRLPALDQFDHAIVKVDPLDKGGPAIWIDPTNPYAALGELPGPDVGRHALVAAPQTDGLLLTPVAAAGQSRVRELRRIVLEESGHPRIFERTTAEGAAARAFRGAWATTPRKALEEQITAYAKAQYEASGLARFDVGTPSDVSRPLAMELEVTGAAIGSVWDEGAQVVVRSGETLNRLPAALRSSESSPASPAKARTVDYEIREPYVYELRYEIVPPHGFSADPLPESGTRALGTASLRSSYALDARGAVLATFMFDSGKARLSPAELERMQADMTAYLASSAPVIRFHSDGALALASGKVREALALFRRLDGEHPRQALHARQIAEAVLAAGLGQAARDEARLAIATDPKSPEAERVLGWTLEHDLLGRRFGPGFDPPGAEAAYRRAIALDANNQNAQASLAILLEHDASGQRSYPRARLAEIERLYAALAKAGNRTFALNHLIVLFYQGRFREVIDGARDAGGNLPETALVLAAIAASRGTAAALREAASRFTASDRRAEAIRAAAAEMLRLRRYSEAATLYEDAARDLPNGAAVRTFAERLRHARPHETVALDQRKPADLAKIVFAQVLASMGEGRPIPADIRRYTSPSLGDALLTRTQLGELHATLKNLERMTGGMPVSSIMDILIGLDFPVEGQATVGYRVHLPSGDPSVKSTELLVGILPEGPRVISIGQDRFIVAKEVLRLARAGRLDAARTWLDWQLEHESLGSPSEPLSGSLLARVWTLDEAARGPADVELAAATLLAAAPVASGGPADATPVLLRERARGGVAGPRRLATDLALLAALVATGKLSDAEKIAADLQGQYPRSQQALGMRTYLLGRLGQPAEALRLIDAAATGRPNDAVFERMRAGAQQGAGRLLDAEVTWGRVASTSSATAQDQNMFAWLRLVRGDAGSATLMAARRGVELSGRRTASILHTLASVLAERDEPERAREALIESLEQRQNDELNDPDLYVLARIAETYGFPDTARALYGKLTRPASEVELSCYALAQRRLARLAQGPSAKR